MTHKIVKMIKHIRNDKNIIYKNKYKKIINMIRNMTKKMTNMRRKCAKMMKETDKDEYKQ